jgi:hypothetical protein
VGVIFICPFVAAFASKPQQSSAYGSCLGDIAAYFAPGYTKPWVWIPAVAGVASLAGGIALLSTNGHSTVSQSASTAVAFPVPSATGAFEAVRLPQAITYPVIDLRF